MQTPLEVVGFSGKFPEHSLRSVSCLFRLVRLWNYSKSLTQKTAMKKLS